MQGDLFPFRSTQEEPAVWSRIPGPPELGSKGVIHVHNASQMRVHHCGHPTANFPYYILDVVGARRILAANGRGFQQLKDAKAHVEMLASKQTKAG